LIQIVANNRELFKQHVPLGIWAGAAAGRFPPGTLDLTGIDLGDELVLDIISETHIPKGIAENGTNTDPRTLGVLVRGVELLRDAPTPQ
jgi:hypothetical protein